LDTRNRGRNPRNQSGQTKIPVNDPSGRVVKTVEAFSSNEARSELPKFKLIYQIANRVPGQWKLKITNTNPNDDAGMDGYDYLGFTPGCP
jgi:hypothetical protein